MLGEDDLVFLAEVGFEVVEELGNEGGGTLDFCGCDSFLGNPGLALSLGVFFISGAFFFSGVFFFSGLFFFSGIFSFSGVFFFPGTSVSFVFRVLEL